MKWFNQNTGDIQNLPSNFPILIDNSKDHFSNEYEDNYDLPPFPPLFNFGENGKCVHVRNNDC